MLLRAVLVLVLLVGFVRSRFVSVVERERHEAKVLSYYQSNCIGIRSDIIRRSKRYVAELECRQRFWYHLALFELNGWWFV